MDFSIAEALFGITGLLLGGLMGWLASRASARKTLAAPVKKVISSAEVEKQQDALRHLREANAALTDKLRVLTHQHEATIDAMQKAQTMERVGHEEELRRVKEELDRLVEAAQEGLPMTNQAFAPTQFDVESPGPAPR